MAARFGWPEQAEFLHGQGRTAGSLVASRPETADDESTVPMLTGVLRVRRR